jgi:hypothetical protein
VQKTACTGRCISECSHGREGASPRKVFEQASANERGDGESEQRDPAFKRYGALFGFDPFLICVIHDLLL